MRFIKIRYIIMSFLLVCYINNFAMAESKYPILIGYIDAMGYPIVHLNQKSKKLSGISIDFAEALAGQLKTTVIHSGWSRKRIEQAAAKGDIHMFCFTSPQWSKEPSSYEWSVPVFAQKEYIVVRKGKPIPINIPDDFKNKHVVLMLGYHYDLIQKIFDDKLAIRIDKTSVDRQFEALENENKNDLLITSQDEINGYFFRNPRLKYMFEISKMPFTVVNTQCAISKNSPYSKTQIDNAILALVKSNEIKRLIKKYNMN